MARTRFFGAPRASSPQHRPHGLEQTAPALTGDAAELMGLVPTVQHLDLRRLDFLIPRLIVPLSTWLQSWRYFGFGVSSSSLLIALTHCDRDYGAGRGPRIEKVHDRRHEFGIVLPGAATGRGLVLTLWIHIPASTRCSTASQKLSFGCARMTSATSRLSAVVCQLWSAFEYGIRNCGRNESFNVVSLRVRWNDFEQPLPLKLPSLPLLRLTPERWEGRSHTSPDEIRFRVRTGCPQP